jgi:hypothetical protein
MAMSISVIEFIAAKLRMSSIKRVILDNTDFTEYESLDAVKARAIFVLDELKQNDFVSIADFIFKDCVIPDRSYLIDNWYSLYKHFTKYSEVLECALVDAFKNKGVAIDNYDQLSGMFLSICEQLDMAIKSGYVKEFDDIQDFLSIIV